MTITLGAFDLSDALNETTSYSTQLDDLEAALSDPNTTHSTPTPPNLSTESNRYQSARNQKRAQKRKTAVHTNGHAASTRTLFEHVQLSEGIELSYDATSMPTAHGAFSAQRLEVPRAEKNKVYSLSDILSLGFTLVEWDGSEPRPLVDNQGRIMAVLAGRPSDPTYVDAGNRFFWRVLAAREREPFTNAETKHRRGHFASLPFGISYGNGQTIPRCLSVGTHAGLVASVCEDGDLCRLANYADAVFQLWAPRLYSHYQECLETVENATGMVQNFAGCAFACATLNLGPQVCSFKHWDSLNLPYGLCSIQSLGTFDPKLGGHLILWDLELVVEFPPHSTILIPSACLTHSNASIQEDEYRISFTQYSAGGLFRWVSNSCKTESELEAHDKVEYNHMMDQKSTRWMEALKLFSTYEELTSSL